MFEEKSIIRNEMLTSSIAKNVFCSIFPHNIENLRTDSAEKLNEIVINSPSEMDFIILSSSTGSKS